MGYIYIAKSCNLQLLDSLSMFIGMTAQAMEKSGGKIFLGSYYRNKDNFCDVKKIRENSLKKSAK